MEGFGNEERHGEFIWRTEIVRMSTVDENKTARGKEQATLIVIL